MGTQPKPPKRTASEAFGHGPHIIKSGDVRLREHLEQQRRLRGQERSGLARVPKIVNFTGDVNSSTTSESSPNPGLGGNDGTFPGTSKTIGLKQRAAALLSVRQQLPIFSHAPEIRSKLRESDVMLLAGETGSGKSTQIPQFLLSLTSTKSTKAGRIGGQIGVTQPRRVAAISLARRVAEEMGTPLGASSPASQVGYSVRFDSSVSRSTKVKFLTDGMLLQELQHDPWLKAYSVVVVDEVHERGVNVDLTLGFLKRIIEAGKTGQNDGRRGVPLKVVVMSATADMEKIEHFFRHDSRENDTDQGRIGKPGTDSTMANEEMTNRMPAGSLIDVTMCHIKGRQYPVELSYEPKPVASAIDAAMERITDIHQHKPLPGDILVFLPGQEQIDSLESMCQNYSRKLTEQSKRTANGAKIPKMLILPLFAALSTQMQQRVFEPTPPFTRKIILSTNIAETSVTVPGIRYVIDTGKRKARLFRPSLNLDTLLTKPISRSSAKQRAGRAGREAPGYCYRLYTEKTFYGLEADTEPEILRSDLGQLVLTLKAHRVENVLAFPLLTVPPMKSLERALLHLVRLRALDRHTGEITSTGQQMSKLPLPANLARMLLASRHPMLNCLDEIIDIVSGMSVENIWLPIHNQSSKGDVILASGGQAREDGQNGNVKTMDGRIDGDDDDEDGENASPVAKARQILFRREGDHLTLLAAVQAYVEENADRKEWCRQHGISHRAMSGCMEVRKQLRRLFIDKACKNNNSNSSHRNKNNQKSDGTTISHQQQKPSGPDTDSAITITISSASSSTLSTRILKTLFLGLSHNTARLSGSSLFSYPSSAHGHGRAHTMTTNHTTDSKANIWTGPYIYTPPSSFSSSSSNSTSTAIPSSSGGKTNGNGYGNGYGPTSTIHKNISIHPSSVLFGSNMGFSSSYSSAETAITGGAAASQHARRQRKGNERERGEGERGEGERGRSTGPPQIMFSELVVTSKAYARTVSVVDPAWVEELEGMDESGLD